MHLQLQHLKVENVEEITSDISRIIMIVDPRIIQCELDAPLDQRELKNKQNILISKGLAQENLSRLKRRYSKLFILTNDISNEHDTVEMPEWVLNQCEYIITNKGFNENYKFTGDIKNILIDASNTQYTELTDILLYDGPEPIEYRFMFSSSNINLYNIRDIIENAENEISFLESALDCIDFILTEFETHNYIFITKKPEFKQELKNYGKL